MRKLALPFVMFVLLAAPFAWATLQTWDSGTFEASPANSDPVSQGDDKIRELKENIRERAEVEHLWGTISSGGDNGRHREGSARAFYESSDPSALANSSTDTSGSGALDEGRLLRRSDTGDLKIYNGSAWVAALTSLTALSHNGNDSFDPTEFHIRGIYVDTTTDASACAAGADLSTTAIASQTFGDAGAACFSVSVDLSSRSTANSRALVLGQMNITASPATCTSGTRQWTIYRDSTSNQIGPLMQFPVLSVSGEPINGGISFAYLTTLSNASHEFALHASAPSETDCVFAPDSTSGSFLAVIDLGPDYP